jgi:DNA-binding NarL/FixJ family response regulator
MSDLTRHRHTRDLEELDELDVTEDRDSGSHGADDRGGATRKLAAGNLVSGALRAGVLVSVAASRTCSTEPIGRHPHRHRVPVLVQGVFMNAPEDPYSTNAETGVERSRIKVLIADDHPLVIAGIRRTLEQNDDIEIVGEAQSGPHLMQLIERRRPGVVLMDLRMPGVVGTECIEFVRDTWPDVKMIVLSASDDQASIDASLTAGANAYIVKSIQSCDIASVIRQAAGGAVFHAPRESRRVVGDTPVPPLLTSRERSILVSVAAGQTTAMISSELWVSEHTIKFHLTNIYRKLGVTNRAGAVRYAFEHDMAPAA